MKPKTNKSTIKIFLQKRVKKPHIPTKTQFQTWAENALVTNVSPSGNCCGITIRIVSTTESATLNKTYRNKTGPTNVLSFPYPPLLGEEDLQLGDIVICAELVQQEAEAEKKSLLAHWAHLTIHGLLHLQGFDHMETQAARKMENLEIQIMRHLGFANPYSRQGME